MKKGLFVQWVVQWLLFGLVRLIGLGSGDSGCTFWIHLVLAGSKLYELLVICSLVTYLMRDTKWWCDIIL
jgi:membrane protein insertase Oxa1/YidC/SpoIIIJ